MLLAQAPSTKLISPNFRKTSTILADIYPLARDVESANTIFEVAKRSPISRFFGNLLPNPLERSVVSSELSVGRRTVLFQNCLVAFQGGGCRAAALVGAYSEAVRRGVNVSEVAGTSAGSIVAALVGAGASPEFIEDKLRKIDFSKLVNPLPVRISIRIASKLSGWFMAGSGDIVRAIPNQGANSAQYINEYVRKCLFELLGHYDVQFKDLMLPTHVVAADIVTMRAKIFSAEKTPEDDVAAAVTASCSIPLYFPPHANRYVDGGIIANLPTFVFSRKNSASASRILSFRLESEKEAPPNTRSFKEFLENLCSTVVDGSIKIQDHLLPTPSIRIPTGNVTATDFAKMTPKITDTLISNGKEAAEKFFDRENEIRNTDNSTVRIIPGKDELFTSLTQIPAGTLRSIDIFAVDTKWLWAIFPTILRWRLDGVRFRALLTSSSDDKEQLRRRQLVRLGAEVRLTSMPLSSLSRLFIGAGPTQDELWAIACRLETLDSSEPEGVRYAGRQGFAAVSALTHVFNAAFDSARKVEDFTPVAELALANASIDELIARLKNVRQYRSSKINIEQIDLSRVYSLTPFVHEFKFNQIPTILGYYRELGKSNFDPISVRMMNGICSIFTPPVLEQVGDQLVLIEGTTRATWLLRNGQKKMHAIVIRDCNESLPGDIVDLRRVRIIYHTVRDKERYGQKFEYELFRNIEESVHVLADVSEL